MANLNELDIDSVAQAGLMFLDGDILENVLIDKVGHVDYDFDRFNRVKEVVMKIEKINPNLSLTAVVWQKKLTNRHLMIPVIAGNSLPLEGWAYADINDKALEAFGGVFGAVLKRGGVYSHYYPIRNSLYEIVGVLELFTGQYGAVDI